MGAVIQSIIVALIISVVSMPIYFICSVVFPSYLAAKFVIVVSIIAYQVYLLTIISARPGGKLVFGSVSILGTGFLLLLPLTLSGTVIMAAGFLWLTRLAIAKRRFSIVLLDLFLTMASVSAWHLGVGISGNFGLGLWCLFLVQSIVVLLVNYQIDSSTERQARPSLSQFEAAYQRAHGVLVSKLQH